MNNDDEYFDMLDVHWYMYDEDTREMIELRGMKSRGEWRNYAHDFNHHGQHHHKDHVPFYRMKGEKPWTTKKFGTQF